MDSKSPSLTVTLFVLFIIGELTFMLGFFPISYNEDRSYAEERHLPQFVGSTRWNISRYRRQYEKVILMIIDAMRFDFITGSDMNYVKKKIGKDEACLHRLKVEAPTVTMPRIKSLTTGTLSNFIDVVLNFGSSELQSDSILHQMFRRKDKVNFYGDNTWTKLFPQKFFKEYANNDSFFVHDFYNGDNRITHDVLKDVHDNSWDLLILHYLGLDHIGHIEGPFSEKVPSKLAEMDEVINKLVDSLNMNKSILLVTADHGMRDSGGHGGNSNPEIIVPLLTIKGSCKTDYVYNQIDFAPTVSILLGLPIPEPSIGCIIAEFINFMPFEDQLYALYYNNRRLVDKTIDQFGKDITKSTAHTTFNLGLTYHEEFLKVEDSRSAKQFFEKAKFNYMKSTKELSDNLASKLNHFDIPAITIGILLATIANLLILSGAIFLYSCHFQSKNMLWTALLSLIFGILGQYFICDLLIEQSQLCNSKIGFFIIFLAAFVWLFGSILYFDGDWQPYYRRKPFLLSGTILYTTSLLSSSFIEEEHQTWYYMVTSLLIYLCIRELLSENQKQIKNEPSPDERKPLTWKCVFDFDNWLIQGNPYKGTMHVANQLQNALKWMFILTMHIFIRRLNQTGDKWIHLTDVGDWLNTEGNEIELISFCVFGILLFLISIHKICRKSTIVLGSMGSCLILLFHFKLRVPLKLFWLCIVTISMINALPLFYGAKSSNRKRFLLIKDFLGANIATFGLIAILLHKQHNTILVPMCVLTLRAVFSACNNIWRRREERIANKILSTLWIGKAFFFYQGNSNNLASIDLNPGFVGLIEYNFYIAAALIAFNTFSGPICSLLILFYDLYEKDEIGRNENNISNMMSLTTLFYTFPACVYLFFMVLFRSHLFIWSVFSPKLLYEISTTCIVCIILIFLLTLHKCLHGFK